MVASFQKTNYLWTEKDKTTIGTGAKIVQATFDFSPTTLAAVEN